MKTVLDIMYKLRLITMNDCTDSHFFHNKHFTNIILFHDIYNFHEYFNTVTILSQAKTQKYYSITFLSTAKRGR